MDVPAGRLVRELYAAIQAAVQDDLRPLGPTPAQYGVLRRIQESPGSSSAQLARQVYVSPQSMHEIVAQLERAGWIRRPPHPELGRVLQIYLTGQGGALLEQCDTRVRAIADQVTTDLSESERHEFTTLLHRALHSLQRQRNDGARVSTAAPVAGPTPVT